MSETSERLAARILSIAAENDPDERRRLAHEVAAETEREYDGLDAICDELADANDELRAEAEGKSGDIADAANAFFDEIERPVGSLRFIVPQTAAADRALLGLHDAIGRKL